MKKKKVLIGYTTKKWKAVMRRDKILLDFCTFEHTDIYRQSWVDSLGHIFKTKVRITIEEIPLGATKSNRTQSRRDISREAERKEWIKKSKLVGVQRQMVNGITSKKMTA